MTANVNISNSAQAMAKQNKYDQQHQRRINAYLQSVDEIYREAAKEAAALGVSIDNFNPDRLFSFDDYPKTKKRLDALLETLKTELSAVIINGVKSEWTLANNKNNELCRQVFGDNIGRLTQAQYRRYFSTNGAARDAFLQRKEGGLKLSDRVWKYTTQFKSEIELGLDVGIRGGLSAQKLAQQLQSFLQHPDMLFRRVRDEHGQLQLSKRAAAYHPGRGVYRSSYRNARRLAATETNMAYRSADYERWQQLDFIVGIQIEPSKTNHPVPDICDDLAGKYPKDFKWTGWHPHCRCHALTIRKTMKELEEDTQRILRGEEPTTGSVNEVKDLPENFKGWLTDNESRLQRSASLPYFMTDNPQYTGITPQMTGLGGFTGTKLGRQATKEAMRAYASTKPTVLSAEQRANIDEIAAAFDTTATPMTFQQANNGLANSGFGKTLLYAQNCQSSVVVHEARLRGLNVTALPYSAAAASVQYKLGENTALAWRTVKGKTPTVTKLTGKTSEELFGKLDKQTKAVGRYHIGINISDTEGHIIAAERFADGRMFYYDTQNGKFLNIREYAVESFEVLKVDKLLLAPDIIRAIARRL